MGTIFGGSTFSGGPKFNWGPQFGWVEIDGWSKFVRGQNIWGLNILEVKIWRLGKKMGDFFWGGLIFLRRGNISDLPTDL